MDFLQSIEIAVDAGFERVGTESIRGSKSVLMVKK